MTGASSGSCMLFRLNELDIFFGTLFDYLDAKMSKMKRFAARLLLFAFTIGLSLPAIGEDLTDLDKITVKSESVGNKLVVALAGVDTKGLHVRLFDHKGNLLESKTLSEESKSLELEEAKKGIYWVTVTKDHEMTFRRINFD